MPTFTPEPTATPTPTETPMPQINMPIIIENGHPKFDFENKGGFLAVPTVQELAEKFGEPPWSQELIAKWHDYLAHVTFDGQPLAKPLANPNIACGFKWEKLVGQTEEFGIVNRLQSARDGRIGICTTETFPIRSIAAFRDDTFMISVGPLPLFAVTFQWWDPETKKDLFRTFVYWQPYGSALSTFTYIGVFPHPHFEMSPGTRASYEYEIMNTLTSMPGGLHYDSVAVDMALNAHGIYDPLFDHQVMIDGAGPSFVTLSPSDAPYVKTPLAQTELARTPSPSPTTTPSP